MFWTLTGALVARALGLVASVVTARLLGREGFGELGAVQSTVAMFGALAGFGLGVTATKHIAEYRMQDPARAGRILAMSGVLAGVGGAVMALVLVIFALPLAEHSLAAPQLAGLLRIGAALVFLGALNGAQTGALSGFEAFKAMAKVNGWQGLIALPIVVTAVRLGGLEGAVWGLVASLAVNWLLNRWALVQETRRAHIPLHLWPKPGDMRREWNVLWQFSLPAMLGTLLVPPAHWIALALLAHHRDGYAEVGLFNAANPWRLAILFVPQTMAGIVLPALAGLRAVADRGRYARAFWGNLGLVAGVAFILALGVVLFSGQIIRSYGAGFSAARGTLIVLSLSAVVLSVNQLLGVDLISRGRMWAVFGCNAVWALALVGFTAWWAPRHGALGAALALLAAYPLQSLCMLAAGGWLRPVAAPRTGETPDESAQQEAA